MHVPQGDFKLYRYPYSKSEKLRAWDAADEYVLRHIDEHIGAEASLNILIINDGFGALAIPLCENNKVTVWSDSFLTEQGISENLNLNKISRNNYNFKNSIEMPAGDFDLVIMKVPKSHALLEDQLKRLSSQLCNSPVFIAAAMVKNVHTSTLKLFENIVGPTKTSLAVKKARLIFSETQNTRQQMSPYPKSYQLEDTNFIISNHANVFSREKLDIGTRFFLEHIPKSEQYECIVDMGCGNGLVGLIAASKNPEAKIIFTDESYMAIASAQKNIESAGLENKTEFYATDCLQAINKESTDLVLNNPPFHQQHATGDAVAWRMFKDARRVLKKGGEIRVIGNRHLDYHIKLKKLFNNCQTIASNKKFIILRACK